jgi:hypothetical protein
MNAGGLPILRAGVDFGRDGLTGKQDVSISRSLRPSDALTAIAIAVGVGAAGPAVASADVAGETFRFTSPGGIDERCVVLARMPGAIYRDVDLREERAFCAIDLHERTHAMCPKLFSTSPGTLVYDVSSGPYAGNAAGFESDICPRGHAVEKEAVDEPISFKMSVNTRETSATFANSSLIYYHFARYFDATVHVPAAVFRSVDRKAHLARVTRRGESLSAGRPALKLNHAAWSALASAEADPESYSPADELFNADRSQVYGVLLHPRGRRYGEEVNGSRQSGWGDGQSRDFQQTSPFVALATDAPLKEAITEGLARGHLRSAIPAEVRTEQMVFWMRELIDITLLDFIFSQQDRIGNIDYLTYWYWLEGGEVRRARASGRHPPEEIAGFAPKLLRRTELGDNDAGVRTTYINYTQRTGMLERIRHYAASTYRRLVALDKDFGDSGPLHEYVRATFGLTDAEFKRVVANTGRAAQILRESCRAGRLRFDLEPEALMRDGSVAPPQVDCENP